MKRIGFLHEQIVSEENCRLAIINAAKHKKKLMNVMKVINILDFYAKDLSARLVRLDFTSPYRTRIIKDGLSGKERELQIPAFYPDQCAHHAIVQVLQPLIISPPIIGAVPISPTEVLTAPQKEWNERPCETSNTQNTV